MINASARQIVVRDVVPGDLDGLVALFLECFNAPPWNDGWSHASARERLENILASQHSRGTVALADADFVGFLLGQKERWVEHYHFNLQEMCVTPSQQRSGIGRMLMNHLVRQLHREDVEKVYLITSPNSPAEAFYAQQGFYASRGRIVMVAGVDKLEREPALDATASRGER